MSTSSRSAKKSTKQLRCKWKKYAASAIGVAAASAGSQSSEAAIHYFNPSPDVTMDLDSPASSLYWDFDDSTTPGNTTDMFQTSTFAGADFLIDDYGGYGNGRLLTPFAGNNGLQVLSSGGADLRLVAANSSINASSNYWTTNEAYFDFLGGSPPPPSGWRTGATGYVGLRLDVGGGNLRYGWAQFTFDDNNNFLTLHDFAYEDVNNAAIFAGDIGVVPEPNSVLLAAMGATGLAALRARRRKESGVAASSTG